MAVKPGLNGIDLDNINGDIRPVQWQSQEERQRQTQRQERKRWLNHEISRLNPIIKDLEKKLQEYKKMKGTLMEVSDYLVEAKKGTMSLQELIPSAYTGNSSGNYVQSVETSFTGIMLNLSKIVSIISEINDVITQLEEQLKNLQIQMNNLKTELASL